MLLSGKENTTALQRTLQALDLAIQEEAEAQKKYKARAEMFKLPLFEKLAKVEEAHEQALRELRAKIEKQAKENS